MDCRREAAPPPPSSFSSEQLRIDEVTHLHSLWYQDPRQNPNPNNNNNNNNNLRPSNPPIFKKSGRSRNRYNTNEEEVETETLIEPVSEVEWPTEPIPQPREKIRWPGSVPQPNSSSSTRELSVEEHEKYKGVQSQNKALKASKHFLSRNFGSDNEAVVDEDEEDFMEDDDNDIGEEESEEFNFFLNLFTKDGELRNYYEKNWEDGDFPCFVCGVSGRKCGKRFKNCVSLVHHSTSISSRKRRRAHRAFGQVLCRAMGWEFKRLPTIVPSAGGPLSGTLAQAGSSQVSDH